MDDTAEGVIIRNWTTTGESADPAEVTSEALNTTNIVYKRQLVRSKKIGLPLTVSRDAPFNYEQVVGRALGRQIARVMEHAMYGGTNLNDVVEPFTTKTQSLTTGNGTTNVGSKRISVDTGKQLLSRFNKTRTELDPSYLMAEGEGNPAGVRPEGTSAIAWLMHSTTYYTDVWTPFAQDTNYLAPSGRTAGSAMQSDEPILGWPVVFNNFFPTATENNAGDRDFANNANIWMLVNGAYYRIRDIARVSLKRDPYGKFMDSNMVGIIAHAEFDARWAGAFSGGNTEAAVLYKAAAA